jgi:hypothetical protein
MTPTPSNAPVAPLYPHAVDLSLLEPRFQALIDELSAHAFSVEALSRALTSGVTEAGAILRAIPIQEGRLLERGIALVAGLNPDLTVLTQNLRLPVTKTALELVEKNEPQHYRSLTLDADTGGRKSYTPDAILINRRTHVAHLIDVKRSLGSYEVSRITELKSRMLAAALVVPDLLYREHHRLVVEEVRVVILNAENQRSDIDAGVWPLAGLDHLVEVSGAGAAVEMLRQRFHANIDCNWTLARNALGEASVVAATLADPVSSAVDIPGIDSRNPAAHRDRKQNATNRGHVRIGFARGPIAGAG